MVYSWAAQELVTTQSELVPTGRGQRAVWDVHPAKRFQGLKYDVIHRCRVADCRSWGRSNVHTNVHTVHTNIHMKLLSIEMAVGMGWWKAKLSSRSPETQNYHGMIALCVIYLLISIQYPKPSASL